LKQIERGTNMLLPAIGSEAVAKFPGSEAVVIEVLNAISANANTVRYLIFEGCYVYSADGTKTWVKPCPSHIIGSILKKADGQPFCPPEPL